MGPSELISKITNRSPFNLGNDGAAERRGREMRPLAQLHHYSFSVPPPGGMFSSSRAQLSIYNKGCGVTILFPTRQKEKHIVFTMFQFCRVDKTSRNTIESSKFQFSYGFNRNIINNRRYSAILLQLLCPSKQQWTHQTSKRNHPTLDIRCK